MITWEEIRDIIEEEVYIGSGTVLGVTDAAKAIVARIEAAQQKMHPTIDGLGELPAVVEQSNNNSPAMGG